MTNSPMLDVKSLKRVPYVFVLILILLLGLPVIGINWGLDFGTIADPNQQMQFQKFIIDAQLYGYIRQILLQWTVISLAAICVLLAFTQYRLTQDKIALIIGLSILFSGSVEAVYILNVDALLLSMEEKNNLEAFIWAFSNSGSGLILAFGLFLIERNANKLKFSSTAFILLTVLLIASAFTFIYYATHMINLPDMWFKANLFSRPYEWSYLLIYLAIILYFYPKAYKIYPLILTNCIFYMAVTQIIMALYLMMLSTHSYDSAYYIAYFFKMIIYFIPFSCLIINYIYSYDAILKAQTALNQEQKKLKHLASHDALTHLINRHEFEMLLEKAIANSERDLTSFALLVLDLDNFKSINDTMGHMHGDSLLIQFADRLRGLIRKGDILSRIGGDEFTLITGTLRSVTAIRKLIERLLKDLKRPYTIDGKQITMSVSIGIAIYPGDGKNTQDLLMNADIAMYTAKKLGKNTYQFYAKNLTILQYREAEIESYLRKALKNDELTLMYQPKFNLLTQKIVGAEVLLRWHNTVLGTVSPEEFIAVAENTGLIIDIGNWIIDKSCSQTKKWLDTIDEDIIFSINISPVQLENNQFLNYLEGIVEKYKYPLNALEIEITENMLLPNKFGIPQLLETISKMGIRISLDDFGKGYSSLARLRYLPINTLKIDQLFIADIKNSRKKVPTIDIIIHLAKELGMDIIAEGVETQEQIEYLIARQCYQGQGFLLCKPLTAEHFEKFIREHSISV